MIRVTLLFFPGLGLALSECKQWRSWVLFTYMYAKKLWCAWVTCAWVRVRGILWSVAYPSAKGFES